MASTFDLFAQGYGSTEVTLAAPLEFPVDLGYGRKVPSLDKQFLARVHRYIRSIRAGCLQQLAHLEDVTRVHSQWQYAESHQLLKAIAWHLQRPFRQAMDMIRVKVIEGGLKEQPDGRFYFRSVDIDRRLWADYHDAAKTMETLNDKLARCERIATMKGYQPLQLPFQVNEACFAPCQSPLELFAEVLRRSSKNYLDQGASASDIVRFIEQAPGRLALRSCMYSQDEDWGISGKPRVMTWTFGPLRERSAVNQTVIRTTKPSWEAFKPLYAVTAELRRYRIKNHTQRIARMMVEHRKLGRLRHEELDPTMKDTELKITSRRIMTQEWLCDYLPNLGFDVRDILACSFNAETLQFVSRCWACRGLAPFASIYEDDETMAAWDGMDAYSSAIHVEKSRFTMDWMSCVKDRDAFPACAEIMAVVANWEIDNINREI